ncbi:MAG: NAD(P)-dependent oxidoreductase, partial [Solirubrobacteraceae bacterium]
MHILLTGASGFIGSALAPALLADGHELRGLTRDPQRAQAGSPAHTSAMEIFRGDVLTGEGLADAL